MAYQPKSYRKFVATAATATLVAGVLAPAVSAASFTDVPERYQDAVDFVVSKGIQGFSDTQFGTGENIKRVDAAVMVAKVVGLDTENAPAAGFTDVPARAQGAVNALKAAGITSGKSTTSFGAQDLITRGELAIWIDRAFNLEGSADHNFTDVADRYAEAVEALVANEITNGVSATQFGVTQNAKRGDFAIFLHRASNIELTPEVVEVSSISATQVEVKFGTAVDKSTVLDANGNILSSATLSLAAIDGQSPVTVTGAKLSADGKTLTLTTSGPVAKRYDVVVDGLKAVNGDAIVKYQKVVSFVADTKAPTIVSTTKDSASSFTVKFSEPVKTLGTVTYKLSNGTVVTDVTNDFTVGAEEVTFTLGTAVEAGKEVIATFVGAQDQNGNLITPHPASVSFVKGAKDGVAPVVSSVTQTGAKTFAVKFSEQLLSAPTISATNYTVASVKKDSTDSTKYIVTTNEVLDGVSTVGVSNYTDLSGENGSSYTQVLSFVKDSAAPKVVSSSVVSDATNKKQYLELSFDKDVVLGDSPTLTATGSFVKDYVTTPVSGLTGAVAYKDSDNKKVLRVELDALLGGNTTDVEGAVYTLNLAFTGVNSAAVISASDAKATFTRGKDGVASSSELVGVTSVAQGTDNNKVVVLFDKAVDGATATNAANYKIDGAVVESVTLNPVVSGTQTAVLNLKSGSNTFTGVRNISVSGVKALGSTKVMETYFTNSVELKENVAPVVTSAKLTSTSQVTLTFSEAVSDSTGLDFEVLVGGKSQATAEAVSVGNTTASTTQTLTISTVDATKLSQGLSLKALSTLDIVDAAGNKVSVPENITVTN
ncbi:MAG: S-layer homology domain-containing protein [Cytobacillus gottheilii]|uniref:S-layer homology domain-containing protein n=1 Tax=Cytobacillus gottheilii TaxID=859144 RepID=UPI003464B88E